MSGSKLEYEDGVRSRQRPPKKDFVDAMVKYRENARKLEADEIKGRKVAVVPSSPTPKPQASEPFDRRSPRFVAKKLDLRQDEEEDVEEDEENPESKEMEEDKQDNENKGGKSKSKKKKEQEQYEEGKKPSSKPKEEEKEEAGQ